MRSNQNIKTNGVNNVDMLRIWDQIRVVSTWEKDAVDEDGKTDVRIFVRVCIVVVYGSLNRNWETVQIIKSTEQCVKNRRIKEWKSVGVRMDKMSGR